MPILSNPRHERFAIEIAKGCSSTEAYKLAGYECEGSAAWSAASRLLRDVKVQARVQELQNKVAENAGVTVQSLIEEAEEARQLAMQSGQPAAAIAAIKEKGVLAGVRVEKAERKMVTDVRSLSDAELDAAIADALAREEAAQPITGVTH